MKFPCLIMYVAAIVLSGCNGGGGGSPGSGDRLPTPQNVSAVAGYQSVTLTWDPVASATGYSIYAATSAGAPIAGLTPVDVSAPTLVDNALPNWQTRYYRVTAHVGGRESEPSVEVTAMPTGGYLVAHVTDGSCGGGLGWGAPAETVFASTGGRPSPACGGPPLVGGEEDRVGVHARAPGYDAPPGAYSGWKTMDKGRANEGNRGDVNVSCSKNTPCNWYPASPSRSTSIHLPTGSTIQYSRTPCFS